MADDAAPRTQALAAYDGDVIAWANEQAALLRARTFGKLDIDHLPDESKTWEEASDGNSTAVWRSSSLIC